MPIIPVYDTMEVTDFPAGVGSYFSPTIYHVDERDQATIDDFLKRGVRFTTEPDALCEPLVKAFINKNWNVHVSMIYDGSDDASEYFDSVPRRVTVELTPKDKPDEGVNDLVNVELTMDDEDGEGRYENVTLRMTWSIEAPFYDSRVSYGTGRRNRVNDVPEFEDYSYDVDDPQQVAADVYSTIEEYRGM